ncbi:MAG TPA: AI-2E family transporter [Planktothrix sp.]|jgi:predicted PurR-regulated permease PerM
MGSSRDIQDAAVRVVAVILAAVLGVWLLFTLQGLIVSLIFALTLASAIAPVAEWGERHRIKRMVMVTCVYLGVLLTYVFVAVALAPAVTAQAKQLYLHLPNYLAGATNVFEAVKGVAGEQAKGIHMEEIVHNAAMKIGHETIDATAGLLGLVLNGLLVMFLTAYFVVEADSIWAKLTLWVPLRHREKLSSLIRPLGSRMGGYVRGQLLVSLAVSAFLTIGLSLLRVNYSLILGVLAGLLNLVPFVGSMAACVFALVVAANQNIWLAGATLALFACEQWVESNFIVPHLLGRHVELHPLVVLFAILTGATLMGVPGALVAVPVTSAALFLAQEYYLKPLNAKCSTPLEESEEAYVEPAEAAARRIPLTAAEIIARTIKKRPLDEEAIMAFTDNSLVEAHGSCDGNGNGHALAVEETIVDAAAVS